MLGSEAALAEHRLEDYCSTASKRPIRIVLCVDQLAPTELTRDALRIGKALNANGHSVAYVAADPVFVVEQAGSWQLPELHQAPVLRSPPHLVMKRPPADGLSDLMAISGFDDRQRLLTMASLWHSQLSSLQPDVIVGFCSPVAWFVGPLLARTLAVGNGYTLPPVLGTSFPRLSVNSTPLADETAMLSNANAVLAKLQQPALADLSEVLARCESILYGIPAFDPYLRLRQAHTNGLLGRRPGLSSPPQERRIAAFLDAQCPGIETIVLALADASVGSVDVCLTGATVGMGRYLEQEGHVRVWRDYASLLEEVGSASVVLHHGAQDIAEYALASGRPQLLIPWTREQEVFAYMIGWMSHSWSKAPNVEIGELAGTLRDIFGEQSLTVAAQHYARQLADMEVADALPIIVAQIEGGALASQAALRLGTATIGRPSNA